MKTTFDLPESLVRRLKLRAVHDRRKIKDVVAELLGEGLAARRVRKEKEPAIVRKDKKSGLPVIQSRRTPTPSEELTPERVAKILVDQEAEWAREFA